MSKERVIDSLGRIDDDMIRSVEALRQKKKRPARIRWGVTAACFCLIAVAAAVSYLYPGIIPLPADSSDVSVQGGSNQPGGSERVGDPQIPWTIYYNEDSFPLSTGRAMIKGTFSESLTDTELDALKPGVRFEYMTYSGHAEFDTEGKLLNIFMQVTTTLPESPVSIGLSDYYSGPRYVLPGEHTVSVCEDVEYRVYQYELGNTITLAADAVISDIYFDFAMDTTREQLEQAKADFQDVLECFACYEEGKPDLSIIVPEEIPELTEQMFTSLSEAQAEPDFGRYLPSELPSGFTEAVIRRFRFQDVNYLSCLWSEGLNDISWMISDYAEEDACRLTSVKDRENYDLSLYPIPRADSVPEELREVVDDPIFESEELTLETVYRRAYRIEDAGDINGWRMKFSVRYGDVVVSVSTKGVEPEWLYHQLTDISSE